MTAVVTLKPGEQGRHYRLPTDADYEAVRLAHERVAKSCWTIGSAAAGRASAPCRTSQSH